MDCCRDCPALIKDRVQVANEINKRYGCYWHGFQIGWIRDDKELATMGCSWADKEIPEKDTEQLSFL